MNTTGISSNDKYLLLLLLLLQLMLKVPSISWFNAAHMMLWSKSHHSSISRSIKWLMSWTLERYTCSRLHWTVTFLVMQNFYQLSIFPADYHNHYHGCENQRTVCNFSIWTVADVGLCKKPVLCQRNRMHDAVVSKLIAASHGSPCDSTASCSPFQNFQLLRYTFSEEPTVNA